jgi:hypothetical protein
MGGSKETDSTCHILMLKQLLLNKKFVSQGKAHGVYESDLRMLR